MTRPRPAFSNTFKISTTNNKNFVKCVSHFFILLLKEHTVTSFISFVNLFLFFSILLLQKLCIIILFWRVPLNNDKLLNALTPKSSMDWINLSLSCYTRIKDWIKVIWWDFFKQSYIYTRRCINKKKLSKEILILFFFISFLLFFYS